MWKNWEDMEESNELWNRSFQLKPPFWILIAQLSRKTITPGIISFLHIFLHEHDMEYSKQDIGTVRIV